MIQCQCNPSLCDLFLQEGKGQECRSDRSQIGQESDNESVATVSQTGLVTALKDGSATITVITNDGGFTATCAVTVKPDDATDKSVVWESSNETVVTVDQNGLVKAVREGDAMITVTAKNCVSASCIVVVSKKNIPVTGIALDQSSLLLPVGNTYALKAHVQPSNATDQDIKWGSSNGGVATVDQTGKVTAVAAGTVDILATLAGKFARCTVQVDNVKLSMKTSSYMILPRSRPINIESNIDANFELDHSKLSFSYSDPEVATIDSNFYIATHGKKGTTKVDVLYKYGNGELKTSFTITVQ